MKKMILTAIAASMMSGVAFADDSVNNADTTAKTREYKCTVPKPANRNHVPVHQSCR